MHACMSNVETSQHCVCLALYTPNSTFVMTKKNDWGTLIELFGTRNVERLVHAIMVMSIMSLHESFGFDHSTCIAIRLNHGMTAIVNWSLDASSRGPLAEASCCLNVLRCSAVLCGALRCSAVPLWALVSPAAS